MTTTLSRDEQLRGRQAVRNALQTVAGDIAIFYNPKLNAEAMTDLYDRPLDIVLFHRTKGLLGIAIKSGEVVEESNGLVSQYQPAKQYYKIIDPTKQAQKALLALLDECDPSFKDFVPISVAVVFPDTHQSEFVGAHPLFLFQEDLASATLQSQLTDLFAESWDEQKAETYRNNAKRIKDFLQGHSDNNIQRVERKEALNKLGVREEKQAYQLPQKPAPGTGAKKPTVRTQAKSAPRRETLGREAPIVSPPPILKKPMPAPQPALRHFVQSVDANIKHHERVEMTSGQWGLVIAFAAIFICVAYFIGRNAGIIMHMR